MNRPALNGKVGSSRAVVGSCGTMVEMAIPLLPLGQP